MSAHAALRADGADSPAAADCQAARARASGPGGGRSFSGGSGAGENDVGVASVLGVPASWIEQHASHCEHHLSARHWRLTNTGSKPYSLLPLSKAFAVANASLHARLKGPLPVSRVSAAASWVPAARRGPCLSMAARATIMHQFCALAQARSLRSSPCLQAPVNRAHIPKPSS